LDREVVEAVIVAKDGRVGVCIDVCLELSGGIETQEGSPENRREDENSGQRDEGTKKDTADLIGLEGENGISSLDLEGNRGQEVTDVTPGAKVDLMD
jgi:CUE domain